MGSTYAGDSNTVNQYLGWASCKPLTMRCVNLITNVPHFSKPWASSLLPWPDAAFMFISVRLILMAYSISSSTATCLSSYSYGNVLKMCCSSVGWENICRSKFASPTATLDVEPCIFSTNPAIGRLFYRVVIDQQWQARLPDGLLLSQSILTGNTGLVAERLNKHP